MNDESRIELVHDLRDGCLVARPSGVLDALTYPQLRDYLVKLALEHPEAVIADISRLQVPSDTAMAVFLSARDQVNEWFGAPILLVVADPARFERIARSALPRFVPIFRTVEEALSSDSRQPTRRLARAEFPAVVASSAHARGFVQRTCQEWSLTDVELDAVQVATELVDNAILHTDGAGPAHLRLEYRRGMLTVAVRDPSPRPAVLRQATSDQPGGRGLLLVAALAKTWGCTPDLRNGKVVWAVLTVGAEWLRSLPPRPMP
ncbi:STAS domain-containing protein [Amycolatopsis sp. NPDC051371]|uniref:STAS domain-containing protein n=1 Tax=Amycolatopsis sp. NPDC051371 TaxID=3155800 RepID=UPI003435DA56